MGDAKGSVVAGDSNSKLDCCAVVVVGDLAKKLFAWVGVGRSKRELKLVLLAIVGDCVEVVEKRSLDGAELVVVTKRG